MYHYPSISPGYIGEYHANATVTSAYFYEILTDPTLLDHALSFPQRIPKTGYFLELLKLEQPHYEEKFHATINKLKQRLADAIANKQSRTIINLFRFMLRYSLFSFIISTSVPDTLSPETLFEIQFIKEIARLEEQLSRDEPLLMLDNLAKMAHDYLKNPILSSDFSIALFNRIIVFAYRHKANIDSHSLQKFLTIHIEEVNRHPSTDFRDSISKSIAYRGIAMAHELGREKQEEFLSLAERYARSAQDQNTIDHLIKVDNLYTCLQSLAKWHMHAKDFTLAETYLREMCDLDPYDCVGYCELGLFLNKRERYAEAADCFIKGAKLGPPGVGMNTYFYAKCFEALSQHQKALAALEQACLLDDEAVSPLLDLFFYYKDTDAEKANAIAKKIVASSSLMEQLDETEATQLQQHLTNQLNKVFYE